MNDSDNINPRMDSRRKLQNRLDPVYLFLDRLVFQGLFQPPKRSVPGAFEQITAADADFLVENLSKHRMVLWLNLILVGYLAAYGLDAILKHGDPVIVVTGLLAPAMITGGAWYAVSFGGIPEKFISSALILTFCMFLAFTLSMTLLIALLCKLTPWPIGTFFLVPMYGGLYIASILYDNLDGLKIGLDTTLLKFSRASLSYYQKHGYVTKRDVEVDVFEDPTSAGSEDIRQFNSYMETLRNNLTQLDRERTLAIANHLIATSTETLFKIVDLTLPKGKQTDKGEKFAGYVKAASDLIALEKEEKSTEEGKPITEETFKEYLKTAMDETAAVKFDEDAIKYLQIAISALKNAMGTQVQARYELDSALDDLKVLTELREGVAAKAETPETMEQLVAYQKKADHLFSQVFNKLLSLINTHKDILYKGFRQARSAMNE